MRRALTALLLLLLLIQPRAGAGPDRVPVLLIHGYGGSPETTWAPVIPLLEQAGYRSGQSLFAVRLQTGGAGLFRDAATVRAEVERIRRETGAQRVDLVGHSRGGLIARILAAGETASLVRRAVSIDTPHEGILPDEAINAMLTEAGLPLYLRLLLPIPSHLEAGSPDLATLRARESRFADRRSPALAIGSLWQEGVPPVLEGHDGIVSLTSQLAWPGAQRLTFRLGPAPEVLATTEDRLLLIGQSPHLESARSPAVLQAVVDYLQAPAVQEPFQPCRCPDWAELQGHWAAPLLLPHLPDRLPYTVSAEGRRSFEPERSMARAEFLYGLTRLKGLAEHLQPSPFADLTGHWALGYVEAAREAGLVNGLTPERFGPDEPLTRAQAATLAARALGLAPHPGPSRFADMAGKGHWAEGWVEAAAARGIVQGDGRGFRPDDPVTMAEGSVILVRALATQ